MHYFDTSALVKLVIEESESRELIEFFQGLPRPISSELAVVELIRAVRRLNPNGMDAARDVLKRINLMPVTVHILHRAALLTPTELRSLDAIHIASALELQEELEALVTYDDRFAAAATRQGITVKSPGA